MSAFSNILLQSRSSEATNIGYGFSSRAVFGWIFKLNSAWERFEVEIGSLSSPNYSQLISHRFCEGYKYLSDCLM